MPLFHAIPGVSDQMVQQIMEQSAAYRAQAMQILAPALASLDQLEIPVQKILAQAHDVTSTTRDLIGVARATLAQDSRSKTNLLEALMKLPAPISNGGQIVNDIIASNSTFIHS